MKQKLYYALRLAGLIGLMLLCIFFFFDLFLLVGLNQGEVTFKVAGIFLMTLISLIVVYRRSKGFRFLALN